MFNLSKHNTGKAGRRAAAKGRAAGRAKKGLVSTPSGEMKIRGGKLT